MKTLFLTLITLILIIRCTDNIAGGGGLDTESSGGRVCGIIVNENGNIAKQTKMQLIPYKHTPFDNDTFYITTTNDSGVFAFNSIKTGTYNLSGVDQISGKRVFHYGMTINSKYDTISIKKLMLQEPGKIHIILESTIDTNGIAYIPGTDILSRTESLIDTIKFDSVPTGAIPPSYFSNKSGTKTTKLTDTIMLRPSEKVLLSVYPEWKHSMHLSVDTSNLKEQINLTGVFPLLFQLDTGIFKFSEAAGDGNDIRFTDKQTLPLPFEIEQWDSKAGNSTIWIRLDSLAMVTSGNFIKMYWGNASATRTTNKSFVFDTVSGYKGVYHINEEKVGVKNHKIYKDASEMGNHADDFIADREQVKWIANGKHFDYDEEDYICVDTLKGCDVGSGPFTISFWFNSDYIQNSTLFRWYFTEKDTFSIGAMLENDNTIGIYSDSIQLIKSNSITIKKWCHLLITRSSSQLLSIYVDGKLNKSILFSKSIGKNTSTLMIAGDRSVLSAYKDYPVRTFNGYIDEFRIETVERSKEYALITYISQSTKNYNLTIHK